MSDGIEVREICKNPDGHTFTRDAHAVKDFKAGDVIEFGIFRVLPDQGRGECRYLNKDNLSVDTALWRTPDFGDDCEEMWGIEFFLEIVFKQIKVNNYKR